MSELIKVAFGNSIVTLKLASFSDQEIDIEECLQIQHHNIIGEVLTIPLLLNRASLLMNDAEDMCKRTKFEREVVYAKTYSKIRKLCVQEGWKFTVADTEAAVLEDDEYQTISQTYFDAEKQYNYCQSIVASIKDKSNKVNFLYNKTVPQEHEIEIIEGTINSVQIKKFPKIGQQ